MRIMKSIRVILFTLVLVNIFALYQCRLTPLEVDEPVHLMGNSKNGINSIGGKCRKVVSGFGIQFCCGGIKKSCSPRKNECDTKCNIGPSSGFESGDEGSWGGSSGGGSRTPSFSGRTGGAASGLPHVGGGAADQQTGILGGGSSGQQTGMGGGFSQAGGGQVDRSGSFGRSAGSGRSSEGYNGPGIVYVDEGGYKGTGHVYGRVGTGDYVGGHNSYNYYHVSPPPPPRPVGEEFGGWLFGNPTIGDGPGHFYGSQHR